jgi:hypothetical protein
MPHGVIAVIFLRHSSKLKLAKFLLNKTLPGESLTEKTKRIKRRRRRRKNLNGTNGPQLPLAVLIGMLWGLGKKVVDQITTIADADIGFSLAHDCRDSFTFFHVLPFSSCPHGFPIRHSVTGSASLNVP